MVSATLFILAPNWKQPKYPAMKIWLDVQTLVCLDNMIGNITEDKTSTIKQNNMDKSNKYNEE